MQSNTSSTPDRDYDFEFPSHHPSRESWENFLELNSNNNISPPSPGAAFSEILFEKPRSSPEPMEEEPHLHYSEDTNFTTYMDQHDFSQGAELPRPETPRLQNNQQENNTQFNPERSECSHCGSDEEEEEDLGSVSTKESVFSDVSSLHGDSWNFDDNFSVDQEFDLEADVRMKALEFVQDRPEEEKQYVNQVMPYLLESMKQIYQSSQLTITPEMIATIIRDLLYGKELMIGAERKILREVVEKEMDEQRSSRPNAMVTEDDLGVQRRKEKKASKGNRNTSSLNHMNENYVSNIFQFARRNYPQDKEIQKIGNERNVSALNFRNLMAARLTDDIMARKAKARMVGSGRELVGNIEYWMKAGYFDQCNDREKYILHKEKALRDLALSGHY